MGIGCVYLIGIKLIGWVGIEFGLIYVGVCLNQQVFFVQFIGWGQCDVDVGGYDDMVVVWGVYWC